MCGIIAHLAFDEKHRIAESNIESLSQLLKHRGPDSSGIYLRGQVALAIRRLSIVDIEGGDQPIISVDGRYVIVFNGEIYNYQEIRVDLQSKGYKLKTNSDTEVLLYAFIDQGPKCLSLVNGMFAVAIWDEHSKELFVARDRLGIKPLYYSVNNERVMFSSELTPFYQSNLFNLELDYRSISDYLAHWYICEPRTVFENIFQLTPGTYAIAKNGNMESFRYWEMPTNEQHSITYNDAINQLTYLLEDSIKLRLNVDVPIGTFLSGGIDSGFITAVASKHVNNRLQAFSVGFKENTYSELREAQQTATRNREDLKNYEIESLTPDLLDQILSSLDEPLGNASLVPTYILARHARNDVKVVLTGDGGDELFGGYPTYQAPYYQRLASLLPNGLNQLLKFGIDRLPVSHSRISIDYRLKQLMKGIHLPYDRAHYTWREVTTQTIQQELFKNQVWEEIVSYDPFTVSEFMFDKARNLSVQNQLMFVDMNTYLLNDHLRKVDRMTMAHGLEARVPFLDHRIVEFVVGLPAEYKVNLLTTKKILKNIAKPYLTRSVINGKKRGLTSPIASWITKDLSDYVSDSLRGGIIEELFDRKKVAELLEQHHSKQLDNSRVIWSLLTLQIWSKKIRALN